jgi:hypothetical protein
VSTKIPEIFNKLRGYDSRNLGKQKKPYIGLEDGFSVIVNIYHDPFNRMNFEVMPKLNMKNIPVSEAKEIIKKRIEDEGGQCNDAFKDFLFFQDREGHYAADVFFKMNKGELSYPNFKGYIAPIVRIISYPIPALGDSSITILNGQNIVKAIYEEFHKRDLTK